MFVGYPVGRIDGVPVLAPMDGILRGAVRDGLEVPVGVKVIEVDPRGRAARWTGLDDHPRKIAEATLAAIDLKTRPLASARVLTYAKDR